MRTWRLAVLPFAGAAFLFAVAVSMPASAGDRLRGIITNSDGGTGVNENNTANTFIISSNAKLTVQCDAIAYVCTDRKTCDADAGVKVQADQGWQTSVGGSVGYVDGGVWSAVVTVYPLSGTVNCKVFDRLGTE